MENNGESESNVINDPLTGSLEETDNETKNNIVKKVNNDIEEIVSFSIEEKNSLLEQIKILKEEKEKAVNEERNAMTEELNKIRKEKEDVEEKLALTKSELHQKTEVFDEISMKNEK